MRHQSQRMVDLSQVAQQICDGDLLLFRASGLVSRLIRAVGRSEYSHAAKAVWWAGDLYCCEVRELKGGRAVTLESQVRRHPGCIDVFETNPDGRWGEYDRSQAAEYMRRLAGCDYGYRGLLVAALRHFLAVALPRATRHG